MQEIRFHGRGGQGAVIGSEVLAYAFFNEDKFVCVVDYHAETFVTFYKLLCIYSDTN